MAWGQAQVAVLPDPNVTSVTMQNKDCRAALDLTELFEEATGDKIKLTMGCVIVRKEFLEEHREAVDAFLEEYRASTEYVNKNVEDAAQLL